MFESPLMMIKVLVSIIFALDIDNDITLTEDFGVSRACYGGVIVGWSEAEEVHCQCLVCMETPTTKSVRSGIGSGIVCACKATREREPVCSYSFSRHLKGFQHEEVAELVPKDLQRGGSGTSLELPVWSRPSFNVEVGKVALHLCACSMNEECVDRITELQQVEQVVPLNSCLIT
jgi:hypothetical protein